MVAIKNGARNRREDKTVPFTQNDISRATYWRAALVPGPNAVLPHKTCSFACIDRAVVRAFHHRECGGHGEPTRGGILAQSTRNYNFMFQGLSRTDLFFLFLRLFGRAESHEIYSASPLADQIDLKRCS